MKILYLTNKPIFPVVDGGCKAMHQFLSCLLKSDFDIKHICLSTHKHPFELENYPIELREKLPISDYPIDTKIKIPEAVKQLFKRESFNISRFDSTEIHEKLRFELLNNNYTHVILESLFLSTYVKTIREFPSLKIIVRTHNVEHKIWEQLAKNTSNPIKRWYLNRLAADLKKQELEVLNQVDLLATISNTDGEEFKKLGITTPIVTIPVAMNSSENEEDYTTKSLFFLGSMNWQPNIEAVNWLVNAIFPIVKGKIPQATLHLAGSFMPKTFPTNKENGIINHGFVEDSSHFMQSNGILVLPIQSGSGVRMKMLEALSLGIPVITTTVGAQGINDLETVCIAESTEQFAEKIIELLQSPEKQSVLGNNAFHYMAKNYSISTISNLIRERLEQL